MKTTHIIPLAAMFVASLSVAQAQTTITDWTFDNDGVGSNASPAPSTGSGTATALGMSNSYNGTNSVSNPDILSSTGSSTGSALPDAWRVRGAGTAPNAGNGWSSQAPVGTQGAEFDASTMGYNSIFVSFDIDTTAQAEANLEVEYTLNGSSWSVATLSSGGSAGGTLENGGSYVTLSSTAGWNNGITASIPGAQDDSAFGIRIVNASTGAADLNVAGNAYNNTSGNWRYDNVLIGGTQDVPEPGILSLAGLGFAGWAAFRRARRA